MNIIKQEWRFKSKRRDVLAVLFTIIFFFLCADKKVCGENFSEDLIDLRVMGQSCDISSANLFLRTKLKI